MAVALEFPFQTEVAARLPVSYSFEEYSDTDNEAVHYSGFGGQIGISPLAVETDQFILFKPRVVLGVDRLTPQMVIAPATEFQPVDQLAFVHVDGGLDIKMALKIDQKSSLGLVGGLFGTMPFDAEPDPNREYDRYGNVVYDPEHPKESIIDQGGVPVSNRHENIQLTKRAGWGFRLGAEGELALVTSQTGPDVSLTIGAEYMNRMVESNEGKVTAGSVNLLLGISVAR